MAWVYLDDQFPDHPKVVAAGDDAGWMFVCGLAYCRRYNTSGRIPKAQVPKLTGARSAVKLAARLVKAPPGYTAGLWEDQGDHYLVHDYDDWNKPQESRSAAGRKAARARWDRQTHTNGNANAHADASETHSETDSDLPANPDASECPAPHPYPTDLHPPPTHVGTRPEPVGEGSLIDQATDLAATRYAQHQIASGQGRSADGIANWWRQENETGARVRAMRLLETYDLTATQLADILATATDPTWLRNHRRRTPLEPVEQPPESFVRDVTAAAREAIAHPHRDSA